MSTIAAISEGFLETMLDHQPGYYHWIIVIQQNNDDDEDIHVSIVPCVCNFKGATNPLSNY